MRPKRPRRPPNPRRSSSDGSRPRTAQVRSQSPRLLSHARSPGRHHLRRQGEEPAAARFVVLPRGGAASAEGALDGRDGLRLRVHDGEERGRVAPHRGVAHQEVQAAIQHPHARRQALPRAAGRPDGGLAALHVLPDRPRRRRALLRAVPVRAGRPRGEGLRREALRHPRMRLPRAGRGGAPALPCARDPPLLGPVPRTGSWRGSARPSSAKSRRA